MIELRIYRHGQELYRSTQIIELEMDGLSFSGVDYYTQEARECSVKLLSTAALELILEGAQRLILAHWHALVFRLFQGGRLIYQGMLEETAVGRELLGGGAELLELNLVDLLGLVLKLGEKVEYHLEDSYIDPAKKVCDIITAILAPSEDTEDNTAADINALRACIGALNWRYAWLEFDYNKWLPWHLYHHELVDRREHEISDNPHTLNDIRFGYWFEGDQLQLIFWQHWRRQRDFLERFRLRVWNLSYANVHLIQSIDRESSAPRELELPVCPELGQIVMGEGNYRLDGSIAYYSGPGSLNTVEVVPGDYKAKDLLGEYLRILNAVLVVKGYDMSIWNRLDTGNAIYELSGALEASTDMEAGNPTEIKATSLASQAIIDGVNKHYKEVLREYPLEMEIRTHSQLLGGATEAELMRKRIRYREYELHPGECSIDIESGEVLIRGRGRRV